MPSSSFPVAIRLLTALPPCRPDPPYLSLPAVSNTIDASKNPKRAQLEEDVVAPPSGCPMKTYFGMKVSVRLCFPFPRATFVR